MSKSKPRPVSVGITAREAQVLRLVAQGCTYAGVGELLDISPHTVATHIKNIYRKLQVHSAGAAVMRAMELRLLTTRGEKP
jgi:DNA-binding CsgD family transcriptional regulator